MLEGGGLMLTKKLLLVLPVILFFCITSQVKADDTLRSLMNLNPEFSKSHNTIFPQYLNDEDVTIPVGDLCYMNGGKLYYCFNDTSFTYELDGAGALGASDWYYIYLDVSTVTDVTTSLVVGNFIRNTAEPTYDATKGGYYNGEDRCVGFVFTDGTSDILKFAVIDNYYEWDAQISEHTGISPDTFTQYTMTGVPFGNILTKMSFRQNRSNQNCFIYISHDGSTTNTYSTIVSSGLTIGVEQVSLILGSSKDIYLSFGTTTTNTAQVFVRGFMIPQKIYRP